MVQSGDDGFACYVHGNNQIWLPPDLASGYTDCMSPSLLQLIKMLTATIAALAEYMVLHGDMLDPRLLLKVHKILVSLRMPC